MGQAELRASSPTIAEGSEEPVGVEETGEEAKMALSSNSSGKVFGDLSCKPPPLSDPAELTLSLNSQLVD